MAIFSKGGDPAVRRQREVEAKLKEKRASLDSLTARRRAAEASAASHRDTARKRAGDGGDDAGLSAAEAAMRREQDRVVTFTDAISDAETAIADLEIEIAKIVDARCRAETSAAINELIANWETAGAAFETATRRLADLARESAVIVIDARPLRVFLEAVLQQVPTESQLVARVLDDHARAVLAGTAAASLPLPEAIPAPLKAVESPPLQTVFCLRTIKWTDTNGKKHIVQQYEDAQLEPHIAARAIRRQACVLLNDPRRKTLLHAHGGKHPRDALDTINLDSEAATRPAHDPITASDPILAAAQFREVDRSSEARTLSIAVRRL